MQNKIHTIQYENCTKLYINHINISIIEHESGQFEDFTNVLDVKKTIISMEKAAIKATNAGLKKCEIILNKEENKRINELVIQVINSNIPKEVKK